MNRAATWSALLTTWAVAFVVAGWVLFGVASLFSSRWDFALLWVTVTLAIGGWLGFVLVWSERRRGDG